MAYFFVHNKQPVIALTIGGSDSGGAAGIQADLKTWTAMGVYGMSALTAVTAQNSLAVKEVVYLAPEMVDAQMEAVLTDYGAQGAKTGFLGQAGIIGTIAARLGTRAALPLVVDPVLVDRRGRFMFDGHVLQAYREKLLPLATIMTPNWREAALLADLSWPDAPGEAELTRAGERLRAMGAKQLLITGVPAQERMSDWWFDGRRWQALVLPRLVTENRHGSGDTLSAALCAHLAQGTPMGPAITAAQRFTARALAAAAGWRLGGGHGPLCHFKGPA